MYDLVNRIAEVYFEVGKVSVIILLLLSLLSMSLTLIALTIQSLANKVKLSHYFASLFAFGPFFFVFGWALMELTN